jgi:acetoacetate decarboxylase
MPKTGYTMPLPAPLYPEPPFRYRGGNALICVYRANPDAIRSMVPEPLQPAPGDLVFACQNDFHVPGVVASYHEAVVSIPVEFRGNPGQYMAYLYLDSDLAIAGGREIWEFPKKRGQFVFSDIQGVLSRKVERGGVELLNISFQPLREGKQEDLAGLANPLYNLKLIPSVKQGAPPDVKQLTATILQNIVVHRLVEGSATVKIGSSDEDPLHLLQPIELVKGIYSELDFDLVHGEVVYDYREQQQTKSSGAVAS